MNRSHDEHAARKYRALWGLLGLAGAAPGAIAGPSSDPAVLPGVVVVGGTPVLGADLDRDQVPEATRKLDAADIDRTGIPDLAGAILNNMASASINDTEGNVFQPDILFRGFTASPVAGTPEGLAVYVNGARFNDAFGDTVNWDLIPPAAIESVTVEASNPLFGLNALGGSVNVRLKNGFSDPAQDLTVYGGSYGRESATVQFGGHAGAFALYVAGDATHEDGFRQTSTSDLYRLFTDLGWRYGGAELHLDMTAAHDALGNPGATPIQALAANISSIFTAPNVVRNTYLDFNLNGTDKLSESASLQGLVYFQTLNQVVPNGTTAQVAPCASPAGLLCNADGTVVTTINGVPVKDFLNGATYSGLSVQQLTSHAFGASVQVADTAPLWDRANDAVAGFSFDGSSSTFAAVAELGGFNPFTREFVGPGILQDQPSEGVNPVRVASTTQFYGLYATDVLKLTERLELNVAGRYDDARIDLRDELGGPVNGRHYYGRFNPGAGLTYRRSASFQLYASYAETNRAPTPQELSCASASAPCSLLNFFVGDPTLKQVVARTVEAGIRGHGDGRGTTRFSWDLDYFHSRNTDDIIYETTAYNPNLAFYTNAGRTLRRGVEADLHLDTAPLHAALGYTYMVATFQSPLLLNTNSPAADAAGQEAVQPGDRIPGIPRQRATLVLDYAVTSQWTLGGSIVTQSSAFRFGDEANLTQPVGGYTVVDAHLAYYPTGHLMLFAVIDNLLDRRYYTYGAFGPVGDVPWPRIPGGVSDPRTASPGMPIAAYGGARLKF